MKKLVKYLYLRRYRRGSTSIYLRAYSKKILHILNLALKPTTSV